MKAILIHGMGRTPVSMLLLSHRLRKSGITPHCFAYSVTFEGLRRCIDRLEKFIALKANHKNYVIITHSLGSVLTRSVLPRLTFQPQACFFLAPPTVACHAARLLADKFWYRALSGEIGQLLANQDFMASLPIPRMPTKIYAGDRGITGKFSPFQNEPNDGVLMVKETLLPQIPHVVTPALHSFIMNNKAITQDIIQTVKLLEAEATND